MVDPETDAVRAALSAVAKGQMPEELRQKLGRVVASLIYEAGWDRLSEDDQGDAMRAAEAALITFYDAALSLPSPQVVDDRGEIGAGWQTVPIEPTEAMWGELARQIVMWSRFDRCTGKALHDHLRHSGYERPNWLLALIPYDDRVPPKGDVAVAIYRAMLAAAAPPLASPSPEDQQKAAATPTIADPDGEARS